MEPIVEGMYSVIDELYNPDWDELELLWHYKGQLFLTNVILEKINKKNLNSKKVNVQIFVVILKKKI